MRDRNKSICWAASVFASLFAGSPLNAGPEINPDSVLPFVCGTPTPQSHHDTKQSMACPIYGDCDLPEFRDAAYPAPDQPFKTINVLVHILAYDDGSSPATTPAVVDTYLNLVENIFAPFRIGLHWNCVIDSATQYRNLTDLLGSHANSMKNALAIAPDRYLNFYITNTNPSGGSGVFAFFPSGLTEYGGIVTDDQWYQVGASALIAHEFGHVFGLYHTQHGVSEVSACGPCYEMADGLEGDLRGDLCSDTPPTPVNYNCAPPGGVDACSNVPWGPTMFTNYMGYSQMSCMSDFTPQQIGRIHCWIDARLSGWLTCEEGIPPAGNFPSDDPDGDGVPAAADNCPERYNPCQVDVNSDGVGDVCACACDCNGDPSCDGIIADVRDVATTIGVAFRGYSANVDTNPNCPYDLTDPDCSGAADIVDVIKVVNVAFRGADPETEFCSPCGD